MNTLTSLLDVKASRAVEQLDDLGRETAESLHTAASSICKGSKAIDDLGESTASKRAGPGSYIERFGKKIMLPRLLSILPVLCIASMFPESLAAQSADLPRFGIGLSASSLGGGVEAATAVTRRSNVRVGGNFFNFNDNLTKDGVNYAAKLKLRSAQVTFDQYIKGGFHISPGILIYNGNTASANIAVPAGQSFSLGNTTYYSSQSNPLAGAGLLTFNKVAPMILVGFGNMLPRSQRHFGLNFEVGAAFQGSPKASLNVSGTVCPYSTNLYCLNAATDPTVQSNVQSEQTKINNNVATFRFFPVISLTLSYKFGKVTEK